MQPGSIAVALAIAAASAPERLTHRGIPGNVFLAGGRKLWPATQTQPGHIQIWRQLPRENTPRLMHATVLTPGNEMSRQRCRWLQRQTAKGQLVTNRRGTRRYQK